MTRPILIVTITLLAAFFSSCSKEARLKEEIIGTWVSIDYIDTLDFISDEIFEKNFYDGLMHPYTYEIKRDSIKIQYSGYYDILTKATTHHLEILDDKLSIDFSIGTYGMRQQEVLYNRIN